MSQELFIEPCCYQRQLSQIIACLEDACSGRTAATFFSSGDWDLSTLLTFMAGQVPESDITLALYTVDQKTLCAIDRLLATYRENGNPLVNRFTLITCTVKQPLKTIRDNLDRWGDDRLTVVQDSTHIRCLTLRNTTRQFVISGSMNQYPHYAKQMYTISADLTTYFNTQQVLDSIARVGNMKNQWRKKE